MLKAGDTFLMDSGPSKHLFVVLADPKNQPGYGKVLVAVCVGITSATEDGRIIDPTCIIEAGEHPFIIRQSFAHYRKAEVIREDVYTPAIKSGQYPMREPVSADLLQRLYDGLMQSVAVARHVKDCL
ncbi:MAG TPA: hypothetical protein VN248_04230 [Arenimonas sp.]|nr:hypothetical protein [Arenimonas sp.]